MADALSLFRVMSYNCCGFSVNKTCYIKSLLSKTDILFLQEHWLSDDQLRLLGNINSNFVHARVSGFGNIEILSGRPFGGCAILWRSSLSVSFEILSTNSRRSSALRTTSDVPKLLLVNVYMPFECGEDMTADFADQLSEVENLVSNNNDCHVVIGGDFKVDFSRNRLHTAMLDGFCDNTGLNPIVQHDKCGIDYSYNFSMTCFNVLDHLLLSGTLFSNSVEQAYVIPDPDNTSDHDPIVIKFMFKIQHIESCTRTHKPRVLWAKATESDLRNYRNALTDRLRGFHLPKDALLCTDLRCNDIAHLKCGNDYSVSITNACIEAAEATTPLTCVRPTSGRIPGWSERVQPLREKSLFWHQMWIDCDRPKTGAVADSMRRTRAALSLRHQAG